MRSYAAVVCITLALAGQGVVAEAALKDGRYTSSNEMLDAVVTIEEGKICEIEIVEHRTDERYDEMIQPLIETIIEQQSTDVDAVTGSNRSSFSCVRYSQSCCFA
jgi:uncharacterized protein with FMN-binding domain